MKSGFRHYIGMSTIFIVVLVILMSISLQGQKRNLVLDHFGEAEGFVTAQALTIAKDQQGFLWIGTENGLARFDGHRFKYFKHNPNDSSTIRNNYIKKFSLDKHGRLLMTGDDLYGYFNTKTNKFVVIKIASEKPLRIFRMHYDQEKDITYLLARNGVFSITGASAIIKKEYFEGTENIQFTGMAIIEDRFYFCGSYGLYVFDKSGKKIAIYRRPGESKSIDNDDDFLWCHYEKENNRLYLGCWVNGLYELNLKTGEMKNFRYNKDLQVQNGITKIFKYNRLGFNNKIFLATIQGVKIFDINTKIFEDLADYVMPNKTKIEGGGFTFCETQNEGLWIGTFNGLYKLDPNKQTFDLINVGNNPISTILIDQHHKKDSILYFLNYYYIISKFDLVNNKLLPLPKVLEKYNKYENITNLIFLDSKHRLWICTSEKGIILYDLDKDILTLPKIKTENNKKLNFLSASEDKKRKVYFTCIDGLYYFDESTSQILKEDTLMKHIEKNKLATYIRDLAFDSKNRMWSTALDLKTREEIIYFKDNGSNKPIAFTPKSYKELNEMGGIHGLLCLNKDQVLLCGSGGFAIFSNEKDKLIAKSYTQFKDKPLLASRGAIIDAYNNIWISTENGLSRINNDRTNFSFYNRRNSAWNGDFNSVLYFSKNSNKLYITQKENVLSTSLDSTNSSFADKVLLTDISISNLKNITPVEFDNVILKPNQSTIKLFFANLNFTNSSYTTYEYRMNNDEEWTKLDGSELMFNNIGYGKYYLEVRSYNFFGELSKSNYKANFEILPPYYRTWWFQLSVLGLISFVVFSFFKYREQQIKKLAKIRLNIARDLHDDLGSNLSNIKILSEIEASKNKGEVNDIYAHIAEKSKHMMASISDIVWSINPSNDTLDELIQKIQLFAIETLEKIDIDLHFDVPNQLSNIQLPLEYRRHIYLIAKEAINNTAKYSRAKKMYFTVLYVGKSLTITFKDDGIGYDESKIKAGNGLTNMKTRAMEMKGELSLTSNSNGTSVKLKVNIP